MFWVLPWMAGALVGATLVFLWSGQSREGTNERFRWKVSATTLLGGALLLLASVFWARALGESSKTLFGASIGVAGLAVASLADANLRDSGWLRVVGIGIAVALLGWLRAEPVKDSALVLIGAGAGAGVGAAWIFSRLRDNEADASSAFAIALMLGASVSILGSIGLGGRTAGAGPVLLAFALVAGLIGLAQSKMNSESPAFARAVSVALIAIATYVSASQYFKVPSIGILGLFGIAAAVLSAWVLPDHSEVSTTRPNWQILASAILWLGVATAGFAMSRGFGMAVAAVLGAGTLLVLNARTSLLSMSPLIALVLFRVFREMNPEATRALDIGQHYALVGLLLGILVSTLPGEWIRSRKEDCARYLGSDVLLGVVLAGALGIAVVLLGAKGSVGLLVGLAIGPLNAALQGKRRLAWLVGGLSLAGVLMAAYRAMLPLMDFAKPEKMRLLGWMLAMTIVSLALAWLFGRDQRSLEETR